MVLDVKIRKIKAIKDDIVFMDLMIIWVTGRLIFLTFESKQISGMFNINKYFREYEKGPQNSAV